MADVTDFQTHHTFPSFRLPRASLNPKQFFTQKPNQFQVQSLKNHFKGMFSTIFSSFSLDYAENVLGLLDLGIFEKGVGNLNFGLNFVNLLIGLCPI